MNERHAIVPAADAPVEGEYESPDVVRAKTRFSGLHDDLIDGIAMGMMGLHVAIHGAAKRIRDESIERISKVQR